MFQYHDANDEVGVEESRLTSQPARALGLVEWGLLIALATVWGGSYFFVKVAVAELQPFMVVAARVGLAMVALHLIARLTGTPLPRSPQLWLAFLGMGILNNLIPFSLIVWGQTQIASGLAAILNATTPVFTVIVAHYLTPDEKLTPNRLGGVAFGLLGVAVLIGPEALGGLGSNVLAQLAIVGAGLSYSGAAIYGRRFRSLPPLVTATGQVTATSALILPVAFLIDQPLQLLHARPESIWALVGLALLSTALAYQMYFRILAVAGATNLLLVTLLIPVSALAFGIGLLGETIEPRQLAGLALIGLGLAFIDGRPLAFARRRLATTT